MVGLVSRNCESGIDQRNFSMRLEAAICPDAAGPTAHSCVDHYHVSKLV